MNLKSYITTLSTCLTRREEKTDENIYFTFLNSKASGRAFCTWECVSQAHALSDISRHVAI
jgi:hypothetical protein